MDLIFKMPWIHFWTEKKTLTFRKEQQKNTKIQYDHVWVHHKQRKILFR